MYFAQGDKYLGPITGTQPSAVTSAVGFNENATLPFQVRSIFILATGYSVNAVGPTFRLARENLPSPNSQHFGLCHVLLLD
jgi:hypothetical protein